MSKRQCLIEGMRDFRTSTRTKVFRFNQKFIKVFKCSAELNAAQWVKFGDTGYDAPTQLHTSHPHGESPSQMPAAASHK